VLDVDSFDPPQTDVPRDKWKRPLITPVGGGKPVAYTRCTTYVGCLEDMYNISLWQQRMVALGLAARPDLLLSVAVADREDKKALDALADAAAEAAGAHAAATTGTALHRLTERYDRGELGESDVSFIPPAYRGDLAAYIERTTGMDMPVIEQFSVCDDLRVGGTPDRIVVIDGRGYIADLKTGSLDWGAAKMAMQLAVYAHSKPYDHRTGERAEWPVQVDTERGIIIHLPAGTGLCSLLWLDIATGWEGVSLAGDVRAWRKRRNFLDKWPAPTGPGESVPLPATAPTDLGSLTTALAALRATSTLVELRGVYDLLIVAGYKKDDLLATCIARKSELGASL
jgi:hypothetical protein